MKNRAWVFILVSVMMILLFSACGRISASEIPSSTSEGSDPYETTYTYATVRSPLAYHSILDLTTADAYAEDMVIVDTMWILMEKSAAWEEYGPGNWATEKPVTFHYDLQAAKYDVDYQKLVYVNMGHDNVNGVGCAHYTVTGTFDGEYEPNPGLDKYPVTMTVSGDVWVADGTTVVPALIRQRILLKTDVLADKDTHVKEETVLDDDLYDINATVIKAPAK